MNKWLPTLATIILGVVGSIAPQVQSAISAHPNAAVGLGMAYAILKGLLPSPITDNSK